MSGTHSHKHASLKWGYPRYLLTILSSLLTNSLHPRTSPFVLSLGYPPNAKLLTESGKPGTRASTYREQVFAWHWSTARCALNHEADEWGAVGVWSVCCGCPGVHTHRSGVCVRGVHVLLLRGRVWCIVCFVGCVLDV